MNEDIFYDEDFTYNLGLDINRLEMGYYWTDGPLLWYYSLRGSRYISNYSTGLNLSMICAALNAKAKEYYHSQDPHPMTRYQYPLRGNRIEIPPFCFTVSGPGYTPVCVLRDEHRTLPIGAAEVLNLRVIDHLQITKDSQWEVVKVQGRTQVRLVRDSNGYTITRGSLFLPVPSGSVPNTPYFSFTTKTKDEEVILRGRLEECFIAGKPDMVFRYDMATDRIL
jgi:hypothetical protein